tara:strand:+ start:472 stop:1497 length:1026 start_codon:yes stop_codon:yes gene_type:complete
MMDKGEIDKEPVDVPMPDIREMDKANQMLKERLSSERQAREDQDSLSLSEREAQRKALNDLQMINGMNLSDEYSRNIAATMLYQEPEENGFFHQIKVELDESIQSLKNNRLQSISNLDSADIISRLLLKGETHACDTILSVNSCKIDGNTIGHNMEALLTNKRLIFIDNDDDVVNTIIGNYSGTFPKSADLKLHSQNYFNLIFNPFRLSDVTDLNVKFRYGSDVTKTVSRGWPGLAIFAAYFTAFIFSGFLLAFLTLDPILGFILGCLLSLTIPLILLLFPANNIRKSPPLFINTREIRIQLVNEYTKDVKIVVVGVDNKQSIESVLDWIETLQSISSISS